MGHLGLLGQGSTMSWGASGAASQAGKGGDCADLFWTGVASPQALRSVLGTAIQGYRSIRVCPEENDQVIERPQGKEL